MKICLLLIAGACIGCSSSDSGSTSMELDGSPSSDSGSVSESVPSESALAVDAARGDVGSNTADGDDGGEDFAATEADFDCSHNAEWTTVGLAHYKNTLGHTAEMLNVARSSGGGTYPVGTMIQLNPAEAMVKRGKGFDATSNDWEFFTLTDSDAGTTTINTRGGGMSVSNARATCLSCHLPAQSTFDLVCGDPVEGGPTTTHGCTPLPVPTATLAALRDPRCP